MVCRYVCVVCRYVCVVCVLLDTQFLPGCTVLYVPPKSIFLEAKPKEIQILEGCIYVCGVFVYMCVCMCV